MLLVCNKPDVAQVLVTEPAQTRWLPITILAIKGSMIMNNVKKTTVAAALGAVVLGVSMAPVDAQAAPFGFDTMQQGYQVMGSDKGHEGKCGEGKCGGEKGKKAKEGKCGEGKCGEGKCGGDKAKKAKEGKCGEGKCGEGKCGGDKKSKEAKCGEGKCGGAA